MSLSAPLAQGSLAVTILASTYGAYLALSPPNPCPHGRDRAPARDFISRHQIATPLFRAVALGPWAVLSIHASALALTYPRIPDSIIGYGRENSLNPALTTWSWATAVPLAVILLGGIPLRLVSYSSLGNNFTFTLAKPTELKTKGIYRHVQHPSYTGLFLLMVGVMAFLARLDGVLSCWLPPVLHHFLQPWANAIIPSASLVMSVGIWIRVKEEEDMLRGEFGTKWERWHAQTARFIPWIL